MKPTTNSIAAAASASGSKLGDDFRVSLTNVPGKESYPISSFTWIDAPAVAKDPQRGRAVAEYMKWFHTTGQKIAQERGYAILPEDVQEKVVSKATTIR